MAAAQDAVYPFMYMADRTGDMKYVEAAKAVFDWHERNMYCDDGSVYNDANAEWRCVTVFESIAHVRSAGAPCVTA